jgi:hypothetical protein
MGPDYLFALLKTIVSQNSRINGSMKRDAGAFPPQKTD